MKNAFRTGKRIAFRPLEMEDLADCQRWINDPAIHQYLLRVRPLNGPAEKEWLENLHKNERDVIFGIALCEGGRLIGTCGLHGATLPNRAAELGILIGEPEFHGKGYGAEAIGLLLDYGFGTLNLHRIELRVYSNNARGIRCYEKCGFTREGAKREARWWGGRWWDVLEYAILAHEWTPRGSAT